MTTPETVTTPLDKKKFVAKPDDAAFQKVKTVLYSSTHLYIVISGNQFYY